MSNKNAIIIVDMSNDFIHDNGGLSVKKAGQDIVPFIIERANKVLDDGGVVVFANDEHIGGVDHAWPKHNESGTWGCELYGELQKFLNTYRFHSNDKARRVIYVPKQSYNAFHQTDLDLQLKEYGIEHIEIVGVCTDICILNTAFGAFDAGLKISVPRKGVATFSNLGDVALDMMKNYCNAEIID